MQNSGISSPGSISRSPQPNGLTRKRFALTGVSAEIDPRVDAVRPDLADVRLAERVFAPHYAAPMPREIGADVALREAPAADSASIAELHAGDIFEVLEFAGANAWGTAPGVGLVGYITASALAPAK